MSVPHGNVHTNVPIRAMYEIVIFMLVNITVVYCDLIRRFFGVLWVMGTVFPTQGLIVVLYRALDSGVM